MTTPATNAQLHSGCAELPDDRLSAEFRAVLRATWAELREIRALICANPEESTIDELRRAIAEGVIHPGMQPGADSWPRLDKPAQVGNGVFGKGVSARFVVESAQRNYEFHQTPEKQAERAAAIQGTNFLIELRDLQIGELTRQRDGLLAALKLVAAEVTDGVRPTSADSHLPADVVREVHSAIASIQGGA